jgi:radical SAM superfamily enzyme YgiQ (UPF0313 family)
MAEVILLRPSFTKELDFNEFAKTGMPPTGLLYIAAHLVQEGYDVAIIDQTVEKGWKQRLLSLIDDNTICVGITSLTGAMIFNGINIAKIVRSKIDCPIVWGGVHASLEIDSTIESKYVDIIVKGEGEETFLKLVNALKNKKGLENVKGIVYKKGETIHQNENVGIYDLNSLPKLPLNLIDLNLYKYHYELTRIYRFSNPVAISIETSRGCTHRCKYCVMANKNYIHAQRSNWRCMSYTKLCDIIEDVINNYHVKSFAFIDDNFFVSVGRVSAFLDEIEKRGLKFEWFADIRMDTIVEKLDVAFLKRLQRSGLRCLGIGIESGSNKILKFLNKGETRETYIEANKKLAFTEIVPHYGMIQGLPTETKEDVERTYTLVARLVKDNPKCAPKLNKLIPTPGTPILEECMQRGFKPPTTLEGWADYVDVHWERRESPWIEKETLKTIMNMYYYNDLLLIATAKPKRSFIMNIIFASFTKLLMFRISHHFYLFPFEKWLHSLSRIPKVFSFTKKYFTLYIHLSNKIFGSKKSVESTSLKD